MVTFRLRKFDLVPYYQENAQRRATRLVPELRGLSYRERLVELNLSTLD